MPNKPIFEQAAWNLLVAETCRAASRYRYSPRSSYQWIRSLAGMKLVILELGSNSAEVPVEVKLCSKEVFGPVVAVNACANLVGGFLINEVPASRLDQMPYGGVKLSGMGREGPKYAIEEMTEIKLVCWR